MREPVRERGFGITPRDGERRRFRLYETLAGTADAHARVEWKIWEGDAWKYVSGNPKDEVYNGSVKFSGASGKQGNAEYYCDSGHWEVYQMDC